MDVYNMLCNGLRTVNQCSALDCASGRFSSVPLYIHPCWFVQDTRKEVLWQFLQLVSTRVTWALTAAQWEGCMRSLHLALGTKHGK
jgi:hypothetical protein